MAVLKLDLEKGAMSDQSVQRALEVKRRHGQELLRKANVVAVGVGYCFSWCSMHCRCKSSLLEFRHAGARLTDVLTKALSMKEC